VKAGRPTKADRTLAGLGGAAMTGSVPEDSAAEAGCASSGVVTTRSMPADTAAVTYRSIGKPFADSDIEPGVWRLC
jgi:hypothetical protein